MFEGLVQQLLLGYLGRYFKDIQKEQLKIRLELVVLENVELILEAFDYLQLPFALKQGRVGRLSIKIPWKKPWDPIIIILEDVFVSASQRDDEEWGAEAVEKREFAGKKAKLAAAELEKLSRRVSGSTAGQSFISHITAKVLDSIQVDIRNFHVLYSDVQNDMGHIMFGLKFSNLTMKQNAAGSYNARVKVGQEHKIVEIKGLEFYSSMFHGSMELVTMNGMSNSHLATNIRSEGEYYNSILAPCDVTLTLSANRSHRPDDDAPQYSVSAEMSGLVVSLDECQLQQMFIVWDYVCICRLRETYGRYRPWHCPLPRKSKGWQIIWWHYAQESVLSDVRKKLKKTSWRYLGDRLNYRRKYINLYKIKLDFLQHQQPVDEDVLRDLEEMEKESDLDDILNYRSAAEYAMRELLSRCSVPNSGRTHIDIPTEKSSTDDHAVKSRGWLNWLSRGMLGAGGTDDSSQFSGVVSFDVEDISEATEFHPVVSSSLDIAPKHELCTFALKIAINQISATLCSKRYGNAIAEIILEGGIVESKLYKEHGGFLSKFKFAKVVHPNSQELILHIRGPSIENNTPDFDDHSCSIQVDFSSDGDIDTSVKGVLQQIEVMFDGNIFLNLLEFYDVFTTFKFHNERVLLSLNGMENDNTRLLSKAEYVFADHKKVMWDITIFDVSVNIPWRNTAAKYSNLVMNSRSLCLKSIESLESFSSKDEDQPYCVKSFLNSISTSDICIGIQLQDLYNYFDVRLNDFEITLMGSDKSQKVSILQKLSATFFLASCVIPDESILKQLEVYVLVAPFKTHFSPSIYGAFLELIAYQGTLHSSRESETLNWPRIPNVPSVMPKSSAFGISISSKFDSVDLEVDFENSEDNSSELMISLQEIDTRYVSTEFQELFLSIRSLMISICEKKDEKDSRLVLSSGNLSSPMSAVGEESVSGSSNEYDQHSDAALSGDACFSMHYESPGTDLVCHKCIMYLNNTDIHCYPHIVGLFVGFFNKLSSYNINFENSAASDTSEVSNILSSLGSQKFGFSNYFEFGSSDSACIPLDHFPFVTIHNTDSLNNLESALIYAIPEWRKYFTLRDKKIKSSKINMRRRSRFSHVAHSKSRSNSGYHNESGIASVSTTISIELHVCGIRVHLHDSSCIIGIIMVPTSKSCLLFCEESFDILSSLEGLVLTSSWWGRNFQDYLWGPCSNLSPILNVRVRKGKNIPSNTGLEVSISIQHVYCMLPSEYLSIIIGYFSLSEWGGDSSGRSPVVEQSDAYVKNEMSITYKFEVLDSTLIFPVESNEYQYLKVEMRQLYGSFIENSDFDNVLKDIPPECLVPIQKLAKRNNCVNVFPRDIYLLFVLCKKDMHGSATIEQNTEFVLSTLIAPINADVWVRIPYEGDPSCSSSSSSICCMTNISNCHIIAEDSNFFDGCMALLDVIDEFSTVEDKSKCFQSDLLQFLDLKRSLKATGAISITQIASKMILTEMKCHTQSLLMSFCHKKEDSVELITKGDFQFVCTASLVNDSLVSLDLGFSTLVLYSPHDSVLAKCSSVPSSALVLEISFSKSFDSQNEVSLCLSSLDVWLHLFEWTEVLKFLNHFRASLEESVSVDTTPKSLSFNAADSVKKTAICDASSFPDSDINSSQFTSQEVDNVVLLIVKSNLISISFHIPVWVSEEPYNEFQLSEGLKVTPLSLSSDLVEEKGAKFLTVSLNMNGFELCISNRDFHLKSSMEKLSSVIMTVENGRYTSSPLCDIFQVHVEAVLCQNPSNTTESRVEIICDHSDVWLSHPAFYLWGAIKFDIPKSGSSQYSASGIAFKFQMRKVSILLTDGKWSYNGAQMEILVRNILFHVKTSEKLMECSVTGNLQVNYNNIEKVLWEPFIEPWQFLLTLVREQETSTVLNMSVPTEIIFKSTTQLNINITESLVECVSRTTEMLMDALGLMGLNNDDGNKLIHSPLAELMCARRCAAPYVLQNLTSVPLLYHVYHGPLNPDELYDSNEKYGKYVHPGSAIPIYIDENTEERLSRYRPSHSSDSLNDQRVNGFAHHYITVQLEGTPMPSNPMSMDLVGVTCFEVNFSKTYNENDEDGRMNTGPTFIVPVVFDVSVLRYSKLIRIYSTVVLQNATSIPLELRFDIPFGVSPTILDPIQPGKQLPLPLHLAEAGFVRWRPMGSSYLWSEAHNLSNLLSVDSRAGNLKSFVCYPSHPSSHPFRCCLSVKNISLTSSGWMNSNTSADDGKKRYIHHLILSAPLIISNYLPKEILLVSESSGVNHTVRVSEVETSVYHIDPSHDLGVEICIDGFKHCDFKFPRLENFCTLAKFSETETKFSLSETLIFEPTNSDGPMYVTVEKVVDACSGSREVIIFVPFILYNCMGFPMCIKETTSGSNQRGLVIPSYFGFCENEAISARKDGLSLLSSSHDLHAEVPHNPRSYLKNHTITCREVVTANSPSFPGSSLFSGNYHQSLGRQRWRSDSTNGISSLGRSKSTGSFKIQSTWKDFGSGNQEHEKVGPCMYSPGANSAVNDILVKLSRYFPGDASEQLPFSSWSSPFSLLPPSGSSTILVPQLASNSAFIVAATSNTVGEQYTGRTNAITFQPRFVISNACSKEISYKQKGTDVIFYLGIGEHAHLHWTDVTRELLVSICYNESGWQWSGSFLPDHLGDTQLKMRNIVFGTSNMIRVEVQNADISMGDEKIIGSIKGNSGTNLILLSDDDTGYMPYRIDNFSKERLRIYQQRCEMFDAVIHSYSSYPYTWDEPFYPHRLTVEVPGERVLGSYALDDVKEYRPVCLPPTSEKPERTFFLSVHAEGATKVLSILDSNYHIFGDVKKSNIRHTANKRLYDHKQVKLSEYKEKISIFIPYIGISLINSYSQELLFGCIKDIQIELLQSLDRQSLSLQIAFLQIDNQLRSTPYPVMLSFDSGYKSCAADNMKYRDDVRGKRIEKLNQINSIPVLSLEISKWRKKDISFISFEYIKLRMADFRLEIEQEVILSLFEFFTNATCGIQCGIMASSDHYEGASLKDSSFVQTEKFSLTADQCPPRIDSFFNGKSKKYVGLPSIIPIGAPWQNIYLLARTQKKVYIEILELAPIKMTLSFSSAPWMLHNRILTSKEFLIHRGLMALADVEGAQIYLKDLSIAHHMASRESIQEVLIRHYNRQLLHEIYKLFGSAGVIGNPLGFVRSMGLGIRDFLSVPAKSIMQSPTGLVRGMAQGTSSLLSNTVYAISDAASQFSKAARKGIVAFTYDDQAVSRMENHQTTVTSDSKGVINEVLEGLTGLLQSPVRGAEKHGLPGVLSGVALGITGLVAKPAASILEVTGKTALSIRNRSKPNQLRSQCFRIRLPRPLSHERALKPYSWEEAVGISVLLEAEDGLKFKDEKLVACKALKESGKFVILTERFVLIVFSPFLVTLGKPEFPGIPANLEWIIEWEIGLENIVHADTAQGVLHIVSSRPDSLSRQNHPPKRSSSRTRAVHWNHNPTHLPLPQTNLELSSEEDATNLLQLLLSAIEEWKGKASHCGRILHRANLKYATF